MTNPLTEKEAIIRCRAIGVTLRKRDGEYRVSPWTFSQERNGASERNAYYTNDMADALGTAWAMIERLEHYYATMGCDE